MGKVIRFDSCAECPFSGEHLLIEDVLICPIISAPYYIIILKPEEKHPDCIFEKGAWITSCKKCVYVDKKAKKHHVEYSCSKLDGSVCEYPDKYHPECPLEDMDLEEEE